ncbi:hypothetical protein KYK30_24625 [Shinella yambaruensis]|uniref:Uncharacterized protein n=1 Tax=Shinella yambaruensis TaxID=415996 RepID=A0ABQ5ZQ04_9HYPH|nr:hypothetical protein [Shinella yambaruensis]MCJ8027600.1 hypothetical protein [Shinella yambaruensis]MCU7982892.1 hypothetical protein [Shinella yambaruensis]GLR54925.1 hypothetical protein GCM10007923_61450 [Shinella yambaruensis]
MIAPTVADTFISLAAFLGLVVLIRAIRTFDAGSPLTRRFLFGLKVLAALMIGRVLAWWTGLFLFEAATIVAAGLVPLATVLVAEGLMRRHAPRLTKWIAAGGAAAFAVLAFLPASLADPWRLVGLFLYQLVTFALAGHMAVTRDRKSLSRAENQAVDRIALSLLLILPLLVTDFRSAYVDLPVRLGGLAILFLCWLLISLGQRAVGHRDTVVSFVILTAVALIAALAIGIENDLDAAALARTASVVTAAALLGVIWKDGIGLRTEQRRQSLIRHLAEDRIDDTLGFLKELQNHPLVEGALLLEEAELADLDLAGLKELTAARPLLRATETSGLSEADAEQLAWLTEKYEATHVMLVSRKPFRLIALNMPSVSATPGAEAELKVVQRMALLISERTHDRDP